MITDCILTITDSIKMITDFILMISEKNLGNSEDVLVIMGEDDFYLQCSSP